MRNDYDNSSGDNHYGGPIHDDGSRHHHHYRDRNDVDHIIRHDHDEYRCHDYHDRPCELDDSTVDIV